MPLEGYPVSNLPGWHGAEVKILASPALGAQFAQYLAAVPPGVRGGFPVKAEVETFHYVLRGAGRFDDGTGFERPLKAGSFGLTPPGVPGKFSATEPLQLLLLRKRYERVEGIEPFRACYGEEADIPRQIWGDSHHSLLQALLPEEPAFDMAMNIFTFDTGFGLPIIETHVMEHGLYFLQGKGVYYLDGDWMEVETDDFIWMGPFCPQSFYATGPVPSRYIYYKNVNRDVAI
jgi:(S)-ureidoglycine aminohydrolase